MSAHHDERAAAPAILLATDGTAASAAALDHAIELARESNATLHVLAVRPAAFFGIGGPTFVTMLEDVRDASGVAAAAAGRALSAGVVAEAHAVEGSGPEAILEVAGDVRAEMIVVGCRGEQDGRAQPPASVSAAVVGKSRIPVVVVASTSRRARSPVAS